MEFKSSLSVSAKVSRGSGKRGRKISMFLHRLKSNNVTVFFATNGKGKKIKVHCMLFETKANIFGLSACTEDILYQ